MYDETNTIEMHQAQLHHPFISKSLPIHYRPAIGCNHRQFYDGRHHLLLNLDNYHVFPYTWLFDILHNIQHNHFTLWGAYTSVNYSRKVSFTPGITDYTYDRLRIAYNCFLRRLELDYEENYKCNDCGDNPEYYVFDGLCMGGRRDLLPATETTQLPTRPVKGSSIGQQVFIRSKATRDLLNKYASVGKVPRYKKDIEPLSNADFMKLCDLLVSTPTLQAVVLEAGNPCPSSV